MSQIRQLAAIMFTDIVGYTALMGHDEEKAFTILKENRAIQKPIIEQYNGKWIKEIGDGIMASFNTVSGAVNAAIKIMETCNAVKDLRLRIGIHQSEVVFENDDVFGDGVNIASRIQSAAKPGSIYVSESVHHNVSNKKNIKTKFIKEELLKNVKEPVRIYEVILGNNTDMPVENTNLSYEAVELLIAVSKNSTSQIVRNPNTTYLQISVNYEDFGIIGIDRTIQKYYDAIEELIKNEMANPPDGEFVLLRTKGTEEARKLISMLYKQPFKTFLKIVDEFNSINDSTFSVEEKRVQQKRIVANKMTDFIARNSILLNHVHYSLVGEENEGKLVALMNSALKSPANENVPYIFSHYKKAIFPFAKHCVVDVLKKHIELEFIGRFDYDICNRIIEEYEVNAATALKNKIETIRKLLLK